MRLYSVAFVFVLAATVATLQSCLDAVSLQTGAADLVQSADPAEQAGGYSHEADDRYRLNRERESRALSAPNLAKADGMDFTDINLLIRNNPNSERYYALRAAMYLAAGRSDQAERSEAQAGGLIERENTQNPEEERRMTYAHSLANVQSALTPGSAPWNRVHATLCAQAQVIHSRFPASSQRINQDQAYRQYVLLRQETRNC